MKKNSNAPSTKKISWSEIIFLIRAYNESSRIGWVIDSLQKAGFIKILVVNDGSRDTTLEILSRYPDIHVVSHSHNRGGGAALETGFEYIRRNTDILKVQYVVTFDADGQHDIADIHKFIAAFEKDQSLDIVFGSRFIVKTRSNVPWTRRMILFGGMVFTWAISGIKLTDSHNGYRMIRVAKLGDLRLTMDGMEYASELIELTRIHNLAFTEVPVNIHYDAYTLAKGQKHGGALRIALRMLWKKING